MLHQATLHKSIRSTTFRSIPNTERSALLEATERSTSGTRTPSTDSRATQRSVEVSQPPPSTVPAPSSHMLLATTGVKASWGTIRTIPIRWCCTQSREMSASPDRASRSDRTLTRRILQALTEQRLQALRSCIDKEEGSRMECERAAPMRRRHYQHWHMRSNRRHYLI
jgi:hypothetical protein